MTGPRRDRGKATRGGRSIRKLATTIAMVIAIAGITATNASATTRIPARCTHASAPRLCAIHFHRHRTNRMRAAMGQRRIPYLHLAERYPARRDRILTYWVRTQARTQRRFQLWKARPWRQDPWYSDAICVHSGIRSDGTRVGSGEGSWTANTGNGYYGGMQFDISTWLSNGGGAFAARPDLATPDEQLHVAWLTWLDRGWHPWPNTAAACGLL